jgi:hypothetical protein
VQNTATTFGSNRVRVRGEVRGRRDREERVDRREVRVQRSRQRVQRGPRIVIPELRDHLGDRALIRGHGRARTSHDDHAVERVALQTGQRGVDAHQLRLGVA